MSTAEATYVLHCVFFHGASSADEWELEELLNAVRQAERARDYRRISKALREAYGLLGVSDDGVGSLDAGRAWLCGEHPIQQAATHSEN